MTLIYKDGTYLDKNPTWHQEDSPWKAEQISKIFKQNKIEPATVCEVGCGAGEILACLARQYEDSITFSGYEVSPQAFEMCARKSRPNLKFFLANALDEDESTFDVVMAIDVFEHIEDYFNFLRKLRDKGVYKVFHIPLDLSVQAVLRSSPIMRSRLTVGHIHYFTKETALAALKDTGYEVIDYFYTSGSLELPKSWLESHVFKVTEKMAVPDSS